MNVVVNEMVEYGIYSFDKSAEDKLDRAFEWGHIRNKQVPRVDDITLEASKTTIDFLKGKPYELNATLIKDLREELMALFTDHVIDIDRDELKARKDYGVALYNRFFHYNEILGKLEGFERTNRFVKLEDLAHDSRNFEPNLRPTPVRPKYIQLRHDEEANHDTVLVFAGLHGDEWLGVHFTLEFIKYMIYVYDKHSNDTGHYTRKLNLIIAPVINADGYRNNQARHLGWRNNLRKHPKFGCVGVDPNRNFGIYFAWDKSTHFPPGAFHGDHPLSEAESQNVDDLIQNHSRAKLVVDIHSGATKGTSHPLSKPPIETELEDMMRPISMHDRDKYDKLDASFEQVIQDTTGYEFGKREQYSGTLDEHAYHVYKIPAVTVEVFTKARKELTRERLRVIKNTSHALEAMIIKSLNL